MMLRRCLYCLAAGSAEVRFDKRCRPYVVCRHCGTRAFLRNLEALYGLAVAPSLLDAAIERREGDEQYRQWFDAEIARLVADVRSARPTEATTGLPAVAVVPFKERKAS